MIGGVGYKERNSSYASIVKASQEYTFNPTPIKNHFVCLREEEESMPDLISETDSESGQDEEFPELSICEELTLAPKEFPIKKPNEQKNKKKTKWIKFEEFQEGMKEHFIGAFEKGSHVAILSGHVRCTRIHMTSRAIPASCWKN